MKRLHIALAVKNLEASIIEFSRRLSSEPVAVANNRYALWRTQTVNLSISENPEKAGTLRHLGFEDSEASQLSSEYDSNGFEWEHFTVEQQRQEILQYYPDADYPKSKL